MHAGAYSRDPFSCSSSSAQMQKPAGVDDHDQKSRKQSHICIIQAADSVVRQQDLVLDV